MYWSCSIYWNTEILFSSITQKFPTFPVAQSYIKYSLEGALVTTNVMKSSLPYHLLAAAIYGGIPGTCSRYISQWVPMEIISILDCNILTSHFNVKKFSQVCLLVPIYKLLAAHTQFNDSLGSVPADYLKNPHILMKKSAVLK